MFAFMAIWGKGTDPAGRELAPKRPILTDMHSSGIEPGASPRLASLPGHTGFSPAIADCASRRGPRHRPNPPSALGRAEIYTPRPADRLVRVRHELATRMSMDPANRYRAIRCRGCRRPLAGLLVVALCAGSVGLRAAAADDSQQSARGAGLCRRLSDRHHAGLDRLRLLRHAQGAAGAERLRNADRDAADSDALVRISRAWISSARIWCRARFATSGSSTSAQAANDRAQPAIARAGREPAALARPRRKAPLPPPVGRRPALARRRTRRRACRSRRRRRRGPAVGSELATSRTAGRH